MGNRLLGMIRQIWRSSGPGGKVLIALGSALTPIFCASLFIASPPSLSGPRTGANAGASPITPSGNPTPLTPTIQPSATAPKGATRVRPTVEPTRPMEQNLAIINGTPRDQAKIERIKSLLGELDALYPETEQEIGDLTAQSHAVLIEKGKPVDVITIMEQMVKVGGVEGLTYKDSIISWMIVYTGG